MVSTNCLAQCFAVCALQIAAHEMRVDVGIGAGMRNVEADPRLTMREYFTKRNGFNNQAGTTILVGADMDGVAAEVLLYFFDSVFHSGGHGTAPI